MNAPSGPISWKVTRCSGSWALRVLAQQAAVPPAHHFITSDLYLKESSWGVKAVLLTTVSVLQAFLIPPFQQLAPGRMEKM